MERPNLGLQNAEGLTLKTQANSPQKSLKTLSQCNTLLSNICTSLYTSIVDLTVQIQTFFKLGLFAQNFSHPSVPNQKFTASTCKVHGWANAAAQTGKPFLTLMDIILTCAMTVFYNREQQAKFTFEVTIERKGLFLWTLV